MNVLHIFPPHLSDVATLPGETRTQCRTRIVGFSAAESTVLQITSYASAHTLDGAGDIMFSGCPSVCACVRARVEV